MADPVRSRRDAGFVLVAVLAVTALLAAMVAAVALVSRQGLDSMAVEIEDLGGDALLRAGLEVAAWQLVTLGERPDGIDGQLVRLDGGTVTVFVLPNGGWVDLNASDPVLIEAAYRASGLRAMRPDAFVDRVLDWKDADSDPRERGAEADAYAEAGLGFRPSNDAFRRVDDLRYVLGVRPADAEALARYFTVHNPKGTINLFEAPREVLELVPGFRRQQVERVLRLRTRRTSQVAAQLMQVVPSASNLVNADLRPERVVRIRVEARPTRGAARTAEVVLMPDPVGREPFRVLEWTETPASGS